MTVYLSKNDTRIRTFIAVSLPSGERDALAALESRFAAHRSIVRWVKSDLLHITIRFLGDVDPARLAFVEAAAREAAAQVGPFFLQLDGMGAFPNVRVPSVVWAGLKDNAERRKLVDLVEITNRLLADRGFPPENRPFRPHITLARVRDHTSPADRRSLGATIVSLADQSTDRPFPVDSLVV